jgi:4-hydroxybenzoate polyprenyltransferase
MVDACHPGPTAVVTLAVGLLAAAAGRDRAGIALTALATFTGQLSIGWCNDAYDAERDRAAGRVEKPTVRGDVTAPVLWRAAGIALAPTVVTSYVAAGAIGGTAHVLAVASAWAYDLRLKTTVLSWLPYVVSFGLVPAFVTYGLTPPAAPAWWLTTAAGLLGAGAHLANAIPDVASDERVGAGGVVARIGVRRATWLTLACLVAALTLLVTRVGLAAGAGALIVVLAATGAVAVGARGRRRDLFRYVMGLALLCVTLLVAAASSLTR